MENLTALKTFSWHWVPELCRVVARLRKYVFNVFAGVPGPIFMKECVFGLCGCSNYAVHGARFGTRCGTRCKVRSATWYAVRNLSLHAVSRYAVQRSECLCRLALYARDPEICKGEQPRIARASKTNSILVFNNSGRILVRDVSH